MLIPSAPSLSLDELKTIAAEGKYNLVPIFVNLPADLETPVSAFLKVNLFWFIRSWCVCAMCSLFF